MKMTNRPIEATTEHKLFIFTFGGGQLHQGKYQPIYATDSGSARAKMHDLYGDKWAFMYTEEEWEAAALNPNRCWSMETPLEPVVVPIETLADEAEMFTEDDEDIRAGDINDCDDCPLQGNDCPGGPTSDGNGNHIEPPCTTWNKDKRIFAGMYDDWRED